MSPAGCRIGVAAYAGKSLVNGSATQYSALMSIGSVRDRESVMPVSVSGGENDFVPADHSSGRKAEESINDADPGGRVQ